MHKSKSNFSNNLLLTDDDIGDDHIMTSLETPLRPDAFDLSDEEKMAKIEHHFREIMLAMGLDLTDDSLRGTPKRVAKMYVQEIFSGLNPKNKPKVAMFDNKRTSLSTPTASTTSCPSLEKRMWLTFPTVP